MGRVEGKTAFITGAARGMGRAHAVRLAQEGADIVAVDLARNEPDLDYRQGTPADLAETAALVEAAGRRIIARTADVRDQGALDAAVAEATEKFGGIDILVSNAGIANQNPALELTDKQWQDILAVNLVGAWHAVKAVVPGMIERGRGGSVVIISSTAGLIGAPNQAHYTASKHGLQGLMGTLANELGEHNIRVNTVNPGMVNTEMAMNERLLRAYIPGVETPTLDDVARVFGGLALLPVAWVEPEDVSNAMLWLASEESRYVTGVAIPVDAGLLAKF
ncbi:mycofactocin-coupled SDR family oxidoreductase [Micromonospora sp. NBC_01638]|nr:mycofactocin-coupled SDR family oxidoreductase [Micromonospora sp. NBC_01638]